MALGFDDERRSDQPGFVDLAHHPLYVWGVARLLPDLEHGIRIACGV